ncbi:hypothetical protein ACFQFG_15930 [Methylobacterium persicinum]
MASVSEAIQGGGLSQEVAHPWIASMTLARTAAAALMPRQVNALSRAATSA